ncbi:F-box protein At1g30200-like [Rhododendron vialii]|uniref:F-box protein At1g30200-like n=1 Tax=Rhododendron vialii TaxID=182163 RepID=UPI00265E47D6|nr:F-box protein At1g30200-like [Rhododendron vialii]XP_058196372.1 F-box protein At1g30200-like [Rhododendron vialii]
MEKSLITAMEEEEEDRCDPFRKLTDDVLGLILTKLSDDPKCLPRCYLVSKHFALFQSQSLSLQLPSSLLIPCHLLPPQYPNPFATGPPLQKSSMFVSFFDVSNRLHWLTRLVSRFTSLRSLRIQLSCECPQLPFAPDHRFSWDFKVGHSLKTFAILSNSSIKKIDKEGSKSEEPGRNSLSDEHYLKWQTTCSMHYANSIYPLLLLLVSGHPNIDSVEIMDSQKHGKVSLHGEQLTKLKSRSKPLPNILEQKENSDNLVPGYFFTLWYVPELRLPRSGFVMKRVTLGVGANNMFPENIDDGTKGSANDFGDDVFGEALNEILTNHYVSGRLLNFRLSSRKP